jgi:ubiquitin-protein ligase E3 D
MPEIYLYAELLIHIRQLTLHASLETEKNEHTKILLSSDKKIVTALHEGENASIYLPTQISGTANVTFPLKRRTELSTKLQIEDLHQLEQALEASSDIEVPWPAPELTNQTSISCRGCSNVIVKNGTVREWKDLPNENWADLMDIWFCHKPHDHPENGGEAAESKGFSVKSKLQTISGLGFVDLLSFLLDPSDCSDIEVSA